MNNPSDAPYRLIVFLLFGAIYLAFIFFGVWAYKKPEPAARQGERIVTDMTGRTIRLDGPAEKVFIATPVLWHYITVNPDDGPVLKIPRYMWGEFRASVLGRIFPGLESKSVAFTNFGSPSPISVEEVLWTDPDVALVWDYMSQGLELVNFQGLVKVNRDGGDKTKLFNALAAMSGQEERLGWLRSRYELERFEVLSEIKECRHPPSIVVIETVAFSLWSLPNNRIFTDYVEAICGDNIARKITKRGGSLNIEQLLAMDPDIIYNNPYALKDCDLDVRSILDDPRFQGLRAVKSKKVYQMPLGASRLEGPVEEPLSMLWLRLTMHPNLPTNLNIRDKIRQTYLDVYGYEMTEEEIDKWLQFEENSSSANYGRLFGK
jgi:iron complex transport system substrate-binding protein